MAHSRKAALPRVGLRVTAQRVAVLKVLVDHPHATAHVVAHEVRARLGTVSTQAVNDELAACVDAGLVRRLEPAGSPALFEISVGDNHHHLVCRACRRTTDVVVFWGLCPSCQLEKESHSSEIRSFV